MSITREQITGRLVEYERAHAVESYVHHGWHVWPLIRTLIAFELHYPLERQTDPAETDGTATPRGWTETIAPLRMLKNASRPIRTHLASRRRAGRLLRAWREELKVDPANEVAPDPGERDAVILTVSNRRVLQDGKWYEIYSDPLIGLLDPKTKSHVVWEYGEDFPWPRHAPSARITRRLLYEGARRPLPTIEPEPAWFAECGNCASDLLGRAFTWRHFAPYLAFHDVQTAVFRQWLVTVRPAFLAVICWYEPIVMAAIHAARSLAIPTVDLQHGLVDAGHFSYSGWTRGPEGGYEVMPDRFWSWGSQFADGLLRNNPYLQGRAGILVGGNPWLNQWLTDPTASMREARSRAEALRRGHSKALLVTLQPHVDNQPLVEAIRRSPHEWLWLLRLHPAMLEQRPALENLFQSTGHPGIIFEEANRLPLYALLGSVEMHLSFCSTCALEALVHDVPTVVLDETGLVAFREWIEQGVMRYAPEANSIGSAIRELLDLRKGASRRAAEAIFTSPEAADKALDALLAAGGVGRRKG